MTKSTLFVTALVGLSFVVFSCRPKTAQDFLADGQLTQDEAVQLVMDYPEARACMDAQAAKFKVRGGWAAETTADDAAYHVAITGDLYDPRVSAGHPFTCGEWDVDKKTGEIKTRYVNK